MPPETYENMLIPIIMAKMPWDISMQVARETSNAAWHIKDILKIIGNEIEVNEIRSFVFTPCGRLVKGIMYLQEYKKLQNRSWHAKRYNKKGLQVSSVEERRKILKEDKLCFNCLKKGHFCLNGIMAVTVVFAVRLLPFPSARLGVYLGWYG